jgi:two-component system, LytTR family, response regulator
LNNSLNILIIEDELLIAEMLKEMLLELDYKVAGIAKNYATAAGILKNKPDINFAVLDINLSETKTGLDVAQLINEQHKIPFIFLTSYSDKKTFKETIELKPEAYLIKPFSKMDLFTTVEIIKARNIRTEKSVVIKDGHLNIKIKYNNILWLQSENIYVEIKTAEKTYLVRNSLDKFLEELNDDTFLRIHRSYAVNVNHVKAVNGQYVLINEEKIPLSRKFRDKLLVRFTT